MHLRRVQQRTALVPGGQGVAQKDRVAEVADVLRLRGLNGCQRVGAAAGATGKRKTDGGGEKRAADKSY